MSRCLHTHSPVCPTHPQRPALETPCLGVSTHTHSPASPTHPQRPALETPCLGVSHAHTQPTHSHAHSRVEDPERLDPHPALILTPPRSSARLDPRPVCVYTSTHVYTPPKQRRRLGSGASPRPRPCPLPPSRCLLLCSSVCLCVCRQAEEVLHRVFPEHVVATLLRGEKVPFRPHPFSHTMQRRRLGSAPRREGAFWTSRTSTLKRVHAHANSAGHSLVNR